MTEKRTIRVAAIQFESVNRDVECNIKHASRMIRRAAEEGAKLVLLPEFASTGYELNENIWDYGERITGVTTRWLQHEARTHRLWIGASYLEVDGDDFYNAFVLFNPEGDEVGRVWKENAGSVEAYLFKGRQSSHIIETELGNIGVLICYDGLMSEPVRRLAQGAPDIILLPHSAAQPATIPILFPQSAVKFLNDYMKNCASRLAALFGVPAILANKTGAWKSDMVKPYPPQNGKFMGYSTIANPAGEILAQAREEETVLVAEVDISGPGKKNAINIQHYGRWAIKVPWHFKWWPLVEKKGRKFYQSSIQRREKARSISNKP